MRVAVKNQNHFDGQQFFRRCFLGSGGVVVLWWMRWRGVGCGSPHVRHIGFDWSCIVQAEQFFQKIAVHILNCVAVVTSFQNTLESIAGKLCF